MWTIPSSIIKVKQDGEKKSVCFFGGRFLSSNGWFKCHEALDPPRHGRILYLSTISFARVQELASGALFAPTHSTPDDKEKEV